jgi:hypothetical protein
MHLVGNLFVLLAIAETVGRQRWFRTGLWLGCAAMSRSAVLLTVPFFLVFWWQGRTRRWSTALDFAAGIVPCLLVNLWYNMARFGDPMDTGYAKVGIHPHGMFSLSYLVHNVKQYFLALPVSLGHFPWIKPDPTGISLLLGTPAVLLAFRAGKPLRVVFASWLAVMALGALYLVYFWDGRPQFAPRYTMDYAPFVFLLVALGLRQGVTRTARSLIALSVLAQAWGLAWWRFGKLMHP